MSGDLRTSIVIDYQNVHLTGHGLFASTALLPRHETLIDPLLFAGHLLRIRNERQREGWRTPRYGVFWCFEACPRPSTTPVATTGTRRRRPTGSETEGSR